MSQLQGTIFDIQHFGVHDGPGIRTLVFFKGCPLRCDWCCNPESQSRAPQPIYADFKCKACFRCVTICPFQAISPLSVSVSIDFTRCKTCTEKPCLEACNHGALKLTGYPITPEKLVDIVAKDIPFYRNSGGGVTFTGGEPTLQPEFLAECLSGCKNKGIHTAIETCGQCNLSVFRDISPLVDLFLFDIKLVDPEKHREFTGQSNEIILDNLTWLARQNKTVTLRFPLIPGITDTDQNVNDILGLMNRLGLKNIDLEPYHSLGVAKYAELGMDYRLDEKIDQSGYPAERLEEIRSQFSRI